MDRLDRLDRLGRLDRLDSVRSLAPSRRLQHLLAKKPPFQAIHQLVARIFVDASCSHPNDVIRRIRSFWTLLRAPIHRVIPEAELTDLVLSNLNGWGTAPQPLARSTRVNYVSI